MKQQSKFVNNLFLFSCFVWMFNSFFCALQLITDQDHVRHFKFETLLQRRVTGMLWPTVVVKKKLGHSSGTHSGATAPSSQMRLFGLLFLYYLSFMELNFCHFVLCICRYQNDLAVCKRFLFTLGFSWFCDASAFCRSFVFL